MKAIGYIRTSTDDQKTSLLVQQKQIEDYCTFKGLELVQVISDEDVSGGMEFEKRQGGQKVYELINEGIVNIVSLKPDRLFRSVKDALMVADDFNQRGVILHIIDMGGASFSTQTAIGRFIFTNLIAMAEMERNLAKERTKSALNHKKQTGKVFCGSVFGYDKVGGTLVDGKMICQELVKNKAEQVIIKEIFALSKKGNNDSQIATAINGRGIRTKKGKYFQASTIQTILNNPIHQTI